jgi:hypothetical protein
MMDKTRSRILAALLLMASGGRSPGAQENPAAGQVARAQAPVGPLGHWKGDDGAAPKTAADASGNGFHGTYSAGAGTSAEVPKTDFPDSGSISLDGATGVVTVPDSPALRITGDITIAFWKRRTAEVKDWTRLVGKGNGVQRNFGVWEFPNGDGRIKFQMYNTGGQSVLEVDSPAGTPLNTWHHVVCTVSVNSAALYMNGALVANAMRTGEPGTSADPLTFGFAGYHAYFPGQLDDIRIYDRALSMSEIVYLAGGHGPPTGPTGLVATHAPGQPVALRWTASTTVPPAGTATYYVVKRSATPGSGFVPVASGMTLTTYTDPTADSKTAWHYVVTAINTGGESVPSNELAVASPSK